jgi:Zn-finger nucleic acid-binding protein
MEEQTLSTLEGAVTVDRCTNCKGLWFDIGEAETLKAKWMSDYVDDGNPEVGRVQNEIRDINCPRCGDPMEKLRDPIQRHIEYEACEKHGMYFDAGEFTDYKHETPMDIFRDFISLLKKKKTV